MAKDKSKGEDVSVDDAAERLLREVDKDYGAGVLVAGNDVVSAPITTIPVSPAVDAILGGGIEEGSWVGVTGNPKTGKTVLCLSFAAQCQRPEYGSRPVYYFKVEGRLSVTHLKGIKGLDLSQGRFNVVQSTKGKILTAQDFLRIADAVIRTVPSAVLIVDSASALCDETEMNNDIADQTIAPGNKLLARFIRRNAQTVPVMRSVVMLITHLIANIGFGKSGQIEKVAKAGQYQYDYMLRTLGKKAWAAGGRQIGLEIEWLCNTSKSGPPGLKMASFLRFGTGIDRLYEMLQMGMGLGLIAGKGWYTFDFLQPSLPKGDKVPQYQGAEKAYRALQERPEWAEELRRQLSGAAGSLAGSAGAEE